MIDQRIDRRDILKGAGVIGVAGALAVWRAPTSAYADGGDAQGDSHTNSLVGTWLVDVTPSVRPSGFKALHSYTPGGIFISSATVDLASSTPTGGAQGIWKRTGEREFAARIVELHGDSGGNLAFTLIIQETITLSDDRQTFSATDTLTFYQPDGTVLRQISATEQATRITF